MANELKTILNGFLKDVQLAKTNADKPKDAYNKRPISYWLDPDYKKKYDDLQGMTGKKFGKLVQNLIEKAIDEAHK